MMWRAERRGVTAALVVPVLVLACTAARAEGPFDRLPLFKSPALAKAVALSRLMLDSRFGEAQALVDEMVATKPMTRNGRRLWDEVAAIIAATSEQHGSAIQRWVTSKPSHAAFLLRALIRIEEGWRARGVGLGADVSETAALAFRKNLLLARSDLEKALALAPRDDTAAAELIRVARGLGLPRSQMEVWFETARKIDPVSFRAYHEKLMYLLPQWQGSVDEVEAFSKECIRNAPSGSRVYAIRLELLEEWARRSENAKGFWLRPEVRQDVEQIETRWLRDFPESTEARYAQARIRHARGENDAAVALYREILAIDPALVWALRERGDVFLADKKIPEAQSDYLRYVAFGLDPSPGLFGLGQIEYYHRQNYFQARTYYLQVVNDRSATAPLFLELGKTYVHLGQAAEAIAAFNDALARNQSWSEAYLRRGQCFWSSDRARSRDDLRHAGMLNPQIKTAAEQFVVEMESLEQECGARSGSACLRLGRKYVEGRDLVVDRDRARAFFVRACNAGLAEGCSRVK